MDSSDVIQLLVLVVLLSLSAFFSSSETALTTVNKIRVRSLAESGDQRAIILTKVIEEQGKMTEELRKAIQAAETLVAVEDLYRPYKPKRRTRATIAREKGLFDITDVIKGISEKMIRRHPHVFGAPGTEVPDWEAIKQQEKQQRSRELEQAEKAAFRAAAGQIICHLSER